MLLNFCRDLIIFIFSISVLITVHEFGHFFAARLFKIKVERFSIGFGPILWKYLDSKNTEYVISAILFGGYVKLYTTSVNKTIGINDQRFAFNCQSIWKRSVVILSGPIFNFILAMLLYTLVFMIGIPTQKPIIYSVLPNSIIEKSGVPSNSEIKAINNIYINDWEEVRYQIFRNIEKEKFIISVQPKNDTCLKTHIINLPQGWLQDNKYANKNIYDPIIRLGILPYNLYISLIFSKIKSDSIIHKSGLEINDKILLIDGNPIYDQKSLYEIIKNNSKNIFNITIERNQKKMDLCIPLDKGYLFNHSNINNDIEISPKIFECSKEHYKYCKYNIYTSIIRSFKKNVQLIFLTIQMLIQLITGTIKLTALGGPISIAQGASQSIQCGLTYYFIFLSLISINLGVINLFPFPILDGGYLLFLIIEKIKGTPISKKMQNFGYTIGLVILILMMCVALSNDIYKLW